MIPHRSEISCSRSPCRRACSPSSRPPSEIDEPIAHLIANATMIVMPLAFFAYWTNSHLAGLLYIAVCLPLFHGRIILCMHYAVHCKAFHQPFQTWACQVRPSPGIVSSLDAHILSFEVALRYAV